MKPITLEHLLHHMSCYLGDCQEGMLTLGDAYMLAEKAGYLAVGAQADVNFLLMHPEISRELDELEAADEIEPNEGDLV